MRSTRKLRARFAVEPEGGLAPRTKWETRLGVHAGALPKSGGYTGLWLQP
jgi:hypothetical protein